MNGKYFVLFLFVGLAAVQVSSLTLGGSGSVGISLGLDGLLKTVTDLIAKILADVTKAVGDLLANIMGIQNTVTAILNLTIGDIEATIFRILKALVGESVNLEKCLASVQGDVTKLATKLQGDLNVCANTALDQLQMITNDVNKVRDAALAVLSKAEADVANCVATLNPFCLLGIIGDLTTAGLSVTTQLATLTQQLTAVPMALTSCTDKVWADVQGTIMSLAKDVTKCVNTIV